MPKVIWNRVFVIKEGIDSSSGGIGIWFRSMAHKFDFDEYTVFVYSLKDKNLSEFQDTKISFIRPPLISVLMIRFFRLIVVRKIFAKFGWESELCVDKIFGISANLSIKSKFRLSLDHTVVTVPLYAGIGVHLSRELNVEVGLVSSTEDGLLGMSLTEQKFMRKYLPIIRREKSSLKKHVRRVAISKGIFDRYGLEAANTNHRIDTPRILDELRNPLLNLAATGILKYEDRKDYVLYIGRCETRKGFDYLLEIWKRIQVELPTYKLILVGDDLEKQKESTIDFVNVVCRGYIDNFEKLQLLAISKFVVIPSRYESFGIVTAEALCFGTPAIVSRIGGLRSIADESKSVMTCEVGDIDAFVKNIVDCTTDELAWELRSLHSRKDFEVRYSLTSFF
jgi:glycosyltransferase involved in cell wall biosynthesis